VRQPSDGCTKHVLVVSKLLKETYLAAGRCDRHQIVLAHLVVNEIKQRLARADQTVKSEMTVVKKKDDCALPV
jgi:hypothetical protein